MAPRPVTQAYREGKTDVLTIADIVTDEILDAAYTWLCKRRKDWSANADVWRFRHNWWQEKERLREELLTGTYEVWTTQPRDA